MARKFFFVSLGLLALSIAYHLGVRSATAQGSGQDPAAVGEVCQLPEKYSVVVNRVPYFGENHGTFVAPTGSLPPIPGTAEVVAIGACTQNAVLANGDVYDWTGSGWRYKGSIVGAATGTTGVTFGQLKSRYR